MSVRRSKECGPAQLQPSRPIEQLANPASAPYTDCWTVMANLTGLASLSVPCGRSGEDGLPVGIMLSAAAGTDADLLRLGAVVERDHAGHSPTSA